MTEQGNRTARRTVTLNSQGSFAYVEQSGRPEFHRVMFEGRILGTFTMEQRQIAKLYADAFNAGLKEGRRFG